MVDLTELKRLMRRMGPAISTGLPGVPAARRGADATSGDWPG